MNTTSRVRRLAWSPRIVLFLAAASLLSSCAVLSVGQGFQRAFLKEEDPLLAESAFPTLIKISEALLEADPGSADYALQTASLYVMYGSGFIEGEAEALPDSRFEEKQAAKLRALALYRRAYRLLAPALEKKAPGLTAAFSGEAAPDGSLPPAARPLLERYAKKDVGLLYWSAAAILSAYAVDPLNLETAGRIGLGKALLERALVLDPDWDSGSLHEMALTVYASFPSYLGGNLEKAEAAYRSAMAASKGERASVYVSYASGICVQKDDLPAFKDALEKALSIDPRARPDSALSTSLSQARARRMLSNLDAYFLVP